MNRSLRTLSPDERIAVIGYSLRSFRYGIASAVTMLGIPAAIFFMNMSGDDAHVVAYVIGSFVMAASLSFSLAASWYQARVYTLARGAWNPARRELIWASILSLVGLLPVLLILLLAVAHFGFGL